MEITEPEFMQSLQLALQGEVKSSLTQQSLR